jgi:hypothetical protein
MDAFAEISPDEFRSLTPERLTALQARYGLELRIRSSAAGVAALLGELKKEPGAISLMADYDRGFDRTSPGYDKYYDRDRAIMFRPEDLVSRLEGEMRGGLGGPSGSSGR